jgi:GNAT superfamily N-acetyltransferase
MSAGTLVLRRLVFQDMKQAAHIHRTAFDFCLPWLKGLHTPAEDIWFYENRMFAQCEIWGAFTADMVGIIAYKEDWVEQLYILPAFQHRGIGSALLEKAQQHYPLLQLWTFQRNKAARSFYEKHGFTAIDQTDGTDNEEKEPDMLYQWIKSGHTGNAS